MANFEKTKVLVLVMTYPLPSRGYQELVCTAGITEAGEWVRLSEWKPEWQNLFQQMMLFGPQQKPLRKIPYTFRYKFLCDDSDKPHVAMCEDWELGVLFLNEVERLGSEEKAAESVKNKVLA